MGAEVADDPLRLFSHPLKNLLNRVVQFEVGFLFSDRLDDCRFPSVHVVGSL